MAGSTDEIQSRERDEAFKNLRAIRDKQDQEAATKLIKQVRTEKGSTAERWNTVFENQKTPFRGSVLSLVFLTLHDRRQYEECIEAIQAAIRNDYGQPWMYDVLAIEMSVAGRPATDINRVLLSRVDFTGGNEAQMLVTVSVLSQFQAWKEAMDICREIARRNPWQDAMWTMACSIADRSKNPEYILWARTGTLRYVWSRGYEQTQAASVEVLKGLAEMLEKAGKTDQAARVEKAMKDALVRDIVVSIKWAGAADLELAVTEPDGSVCGFRNKLTKNGGVLVKQGDGGQRGKEEVYVCREALPGDYMIGVKSLIGRVIRGKVLVKVTRYAGTDREVAKTAFYEVGAKDLSITVPLKNGRKTD